MRLFYFQFLPLSDFLHLKSANIKTVSSIFSFIYKFLFVELSRVYHISQWKNTLRRSEISCFAAVVVAVRVLCRPPQKNPQTEWSGDCGGALSTTLEPLSRHIVAAVRALQTKKRRYLGTLHSLLVCFFQLIFVQSNAVQQITLILGGCIIIDSEPFADSTELVKHFNSSRGHSFDFDIHKNSFSQKRESKNRPVAADFQFLKISCPSGTSLLQLL